jgi:hypothetical protein
MYACSSFLVLLPDVIQGVLLVGILGGGATPSTTFAHDAEMSRTKAYLVFILAFTAIQNLIVSSSMHVGAINPLIILYRDLQRQHVI